MNRLIYQHIFRFIFLVFLQVYVLNNIVFMGYLNPYLYILFILLLPLETPKWLLLISAFFLGLSVDYFSNTIGLNIAATLLVAYVRPGLINLISPKMDLGQGVKIGIRDLGFGWFFMYSTILIVIHHICLFLLETFRFNELLDTLGRALMSAVFTIGLVILSQYIFYKPKKD